MARRGKSNGNGHASGETPETLNGDSARDRFLVAVKHVESAKAKADEARGDIGQLYHQAEEDGFHRRALKEAMRLKRMEQEKRRDYLTNLNLYCDWIGIYDQGEVFDDAPRPPQPDPDPLDAAEADLRELRERSAGANQDTAGYTHEVGRQAGIAGTSPHDNPWPEGTKAHGTWNDGWLAGQEELVGQTVGKRKRGRPRKVSPESGEAQVH